MSARDGKFIPPTLWNQFGGSFGGPIQKDKTFYFGDYQANRQHNGASLLTRVPTAAERSGDLSGLNTPIFNPCNGTDCNIAPAARQQFAGNIIPTNLLSPQAQNLLKSIPLPNVAGVSGAVPNFVAAGQGVLNSDSFNVRIDRYQTEKLHIFGRYSFMKYEQGAPGAFGLAAGGPQFAVAGFAGTSSLRDQSLAAGFDYSIRPTWLTDFRFGFFRYRVFVNPNGVGTSPAKDAGIPGLNLDYLLHLRHAPLRAERHRRFQLRLLARPSISCNCPLNQQENEFQWVSNTTHVVGNHSLKFGADWRHGQNLRVPSDSHRSGQLTFDPTTTQGPNGGGLGLASFLLGQVNSFTRYVSNSTEAAERQNRLFSYVQDTWKITPKLTMNIGMRWEIYFPQYVNGKDNGGFQNLSTGEVMITGENGVSMNGNVKTALTHFAPRIGLAYQLDPKTVIRTGYGRSYDVGVFGVSYGHNVTQNLPVLANQSLNPAQPWLSVFTLAQGPTPLDPTHHPGLAAQGSQRQSHAAQRRRAQRAAADQQRHHAAAGGGCLELHHRAPDHAEHGFLHRLHRQQGLSRDARRHQLQHQSAQHRRLRHAHHQPAPPLLPEVRLDPEHQVFQRRCQREVQLAAGAR